MSQHDYAIDDGTGASVLADINAALAAAATWNSGPVAPSPTFPYMVWVDTAANAVKQRNGADSAWVTIALFVGATHTYVGNGTTPAGGGAGQVLAKASSTDHDIAWVNPPAGVAGNPAGASSHLQFNASGVFGASANLRWNDAGNQLTIEGGDAADDFAVIVKAKTAGGESIQCQNVDGYATLELRTEASGAGNFQIRPGLSSGNDSVFLVSGTSGDPYVVVGGTTVNRVGSSMMTVMGPTFLCTPTFGDATDPTRRVVFDLTGVMAGQTRIITVPDFDVTLGAGGGPGDSPGSLVFGNRFGDDAGLQLLLDRFT